MKGMEKVSGEDLDRVKQWAKEKVAQGSEPPWAWYQYMKLIETIDAIRKGQNATQPHSTASSPQSPQHSGGRLRLVDATCQQDSVQPHPVDMPI